MRVYIRINHSRPESYGDDPRFFLSQSSRYGLYLLAIGDSIVGYTNLHKLFIAALPAL